VFYFGSSNSGLLSNLVASFYWGLSSTFGFSALFSSYFLSNLISNSAGVQSASFPAVSPSSMIAGLNSYSFIFPAYQFLFSSLLFPILILSSPSYHTVWLSLPSKWSMFAFGWPLLSIIWEPEASWAPWILYQASL